MLIQVSQNHMAEASKPVSPPPHLPNLANSPQSNQSGELSTNQTELVSPPSINISAFNTKLPSLHFMWALPATPVAFKHRPSLLASRD